MLLVLATLVCCAYTPFRQAILMTLRVSAVCPAECHFGGGVLDNKTKCYSGLMTMTIYEAKLLNMVLGILSIENSYHFVTFKKTFALKIEMI